jgi:hypothetical protein
MNPASAGGELAAEAYAFAYPLVTMGMTRRVMTNVEEPRGLSGPMGWLTKARVYPDASFHDVPAPNADTLYTMAWLDVAKEPWVVTVPDSEGRYYLLPMLSGWTEVFEAPGTRTTGNGPQQLMISGPGWNGQVPTGLTELRAPTSLVWLLGRLYCSGTPEDYAATHAMQDAMEVMPLSAYGTAYTPPPATIDPTVDMTTPVRDQVNALDAQAYYSLFAELLKANPPTAADAPMVAELATIGIVPGQDLDWSTVDPAMQKALDDAIAPTQGQIFAHFADLGETSNGWTFPLKTGSYGTDYLDRATIAMLGLGANLPADSVYPTSPEDADGNPYSGANRYVMHFDKGRMPPADAFWSMTMYDEKYFLVDNPLDRYTVGSRTEFVENADGSVDVHIQKDSPGQDKEPNWLPAPAGQFVLMLRLYMPSPTPPSILDGTWTVPPVTRTTEP